jgi:hypothetical protein
VQAAIANEQTKAAARELGMGVREFLNTQPGQFDAKRIIAGRMLLHGALEATRRAALKVVNGGTAEDKLAFERAKFVTALIQDHMKGATAEIGRTLQALKIVSTKDDARLAAVRQMIGSRGGHDRIEDSAQAFLDLAEDPAKANRFIAKDTKATWLQMFNEGVTMARLTNPVTHARNFIGNAAAAAVSFPETATEAALGKLFNSPDRSYISEVGARAGAIRSALPDAMRNMVKVFRTGEPIDGVSKVEAQLNYKAIPGRAGEVVRIPGRAMTAADEAWKTLIYADHIAALARRQAIRAGLQGGERAAMEAQLRNAPTAEMLDSAKIEARYRTFQQELGTWGKQLQTISNTWPGAKILLTFVRTPINLVKFAGERSVFGVAMPSVLRKLSQGGRARDEALSRIIVGSTISTAATAAALNGHVSGNGPDDPRQRSALMQTGWRPNSVRIGDKWVSYQGLDPVSTLVAVAADFAESGKWGTPKERQAIATNLALSAAESASNRTWMGGVADLGTLRVGGGDLGRIERKAVVLGVGQEIGRRGLHIVPDRQIAFSNLRPETLERGRFVEECNVRALAIDTGLSGSPRAVPASELRGHFGVRLEAAKTIKARKALGFHVGTELRRAAQIIRLSHPVTKPQRVVRGICHWIGREIDYWTAISLSAGRIARHTGRNPRQHEAARLCPQRDQRSIRTAALLSQLERVEAEQAPIAAIGQAYRVAIVCLPRERHRRQRRGRRQGGARGGKHSRRLSEATALLQRCARRERRKAAVGRSRRSWGHVPAGKLQMDMVALIQDASVRPPASDRRCAGLKLLER